MVDDYVTKYCEDNRECETTMVTHRCFYLPAKEYENLE